MANKVNTKRVVIEIHNIIDGGIVATCPWCGDSHQAMFGTTQTKAINAHFREVHKGKKPKWTAKDLTKKAEEAIVESIVEEISEPEIVETLDVVVEKTLTADPDMDILAHLRKTHKTLQDFASTVSTSVEDNKVIAKDKDEFFTIMADIQSTIGGIEKKMWELDSINTTEAQKDKNVLWAQYTDAKETLFSAINHPWYEDWKAKKEADEAEKERIAQAKALEAEKASLEKHWNNTTFSNSRQNELFFNRLMEGSMWLPVKDMDDRNKKTLKRDDREPFMWATWFKTRGIVKSKAKKDGVRLEPWEYTYEKMCLDEVEDGKTALELALKKTLDGYIDWAYESDEPVTAELKLSNGEKFTVEHVPFNRKDAYFYVQEAIGKVIDSFRDSRGMKPEKAMKKHLALWDADKAEKAYWLGDRGTKERAERPHRISEDTSMDGGLMMRAKMIEAGLIENEPHPDGK